MIMIAFLPPISRWTFLKNGAAFWFTSLPTAVDPVNDTTDTSGCVVSVSPTAGPPVTRFTTPGGTPASSRTLTKCTAESGVSSDGFNTTVLPHTSAGMIFHDGIAIGKFHGVIIEHTPSGCRSDIR